MRAQKQRRKDYESGGKRAAEKMRLKKKKNANRLAIGGGQDAFSQNEPFIVEFVIMNRAFSNNIFLC